MAGNTPNTKAESGNISKCLIHSNRGSGSADISGGIVDFSYFESILDNSVRFTLIVLDSGHNEGKPDDIAILYKLKLSGFERVELTFNDNNNNQLKFTGNNALYINKISNILSSSETMLYTIDLCSKEVLANDFLKSEVYQRFDGEISQSVSIILKEILKTKKNIISDPTENKYNFYGSGKKPFDLIAEVATMGVPQGAKSSAGYFIFETYDGFNFKAIDKLFEGSPKKKFIYNDSTLLPTGYDAKIINYKSLKTIDVQKNLDSGAYGGRLETFNPYTQSFNPKAKEVDNEAQKPRGGQEFPKISSDFSVYGDYTRRYSHRMDVGQSPSGNKGRQLEKRKEENLESAKTLVQSGMTYNKLFTLSLEISVPGDFSLRAGQMVHCDFPEQSGKKEMIANRELSGIYIISDICHYLTPKACLTKMTLVRDSYGRKPR